jgi:hypothetical protein
VAKAGERCRRSAHDQPAAVSATAHGRSVILAISKFSDMDLEKIKDFVYDAKAGEGILVYVVDRGVQINVKNVSIRQPFASWRFWH